jgi:CheY-like chemotaxis protein
VYGIVRQNRGWIDVESELGKGSAFLIYLPQASAEDEISGVKTEQTPALQGNETILVVEDEEPVRRLTANVLKRRGFRVLEACTGAEAKGVAAEHGGQIDLLLTDVVMPGISGRALAEAIRKAYPRMRVVLMSGYAEEIDVDRSAYVADAFLEKPFTATTLIQTIRQALG